jgi:4-hydroxythreonine-4-phosphate dehydrogenase
MPLAISMGEPAGIGPDIVLSTWSRREEAALPAFFICGDEQLLAHRAQALGLHVPIELIDRPDQASSTFPNALPVIQIDGYTSGGAGQPSANDPPLILQSLERCLAFCLEGSARALVTCPINKAALYNDGFSYQGHTDFLADRLHQITGEPVTELMMLCAPGLHPPLRVVPLTIHQPLRDVAKALTSEAIIAASLQLQHSLKAELGIEQPKIAVAGLNPHAGEEGALGNEEQEIIIPAIDALIAQGVAIEGPFPADTLFHAEARQRFDAILCMYHDQALIPIKTLDFHGGVNVTLGLPIIRTSPDHGTGFDIAGSGQARPDSFIAALRQADQMAQNRQFQRSVQ